MGGKILVLTELASQSTAKSCNVFSFPGFENARLEALPLCHSETTRTAGRSPEACIPKQSLGTKNLSGAHCTFPHRARSSRLDLERQNDVADLASLAIPHQLNLTLLFEQEKAVLVWQRFICFDEPNDFLLFLISESRHAHPLRQMISSSTGISRR